uniref:Polyribonucleotide nucleotidyltransferase n=1 Tax=Strongyloides venezuelensis TaxID=75913 RepID=A0A0K0EUZ9_STRVS
MLKIFRKHPQLLKYNIIKRNYNNEYKKSTATLKNGLSYTFESGRMARFADGSIVISQGENALLSTTVKGKDKVNAGFLNLMVDYKPNAAAVGKIPENYLRKEFINSDADILTSRCIDRSLRPLFKENYDFPVQIICKPLSFDDDSDSVVLSINASSASAYCANLPLIDPVGAVRVAHVDDKILVNPNKHLLKKSMINLLITGTDKGKIVMLEMEGKEVPFSILQSCIEEGVESIKTIIKSIKELNPNFVPYDPQKSSLSDVEFEIQSLIRHLAENELQFIFTDITLDKEERDEKVRNVGKTIEADLGSQFKMIDFSTHFQKHFSKVVKEILRKETIISQKRMDGRDLNEIRPIKIEVDVYKKLHGSAIFQRGQSQVLSTVTFDSPESAFRPNSITQLFGLQEEKKFIHHYEFPSYAINEIKQQARSNRREIGHGILAERALKNLIPSDFPFTIRLNTEVLESNGSTSMAAVVGGTLALRDASVHLKSPVAGVAMGLMTSENSSDSEKKVILTDINGMEDYAGDMDFKIAGTKDGFTAMQLDIKIPGLTLNLLYEALHKSRKGLNFIINKIFEMQPDTREEFKKTVPVLEVINIPMKVKMALFQNGGYNYKLIESETGVKIKQEDELVLRIFAPNAKKFQEAKDMILNLAEVDRQANLDFGGIYEAEIVEILRSGFMIKFEKGTKPIFIKNSDIAGGKSKVPDSAMFNKKVGDKISVKYFGDDPCTGKMRLSCISLIGKK